MPYLKIFVEFNDNGTYSLNLAKTDKLGESDSLVDALCELAHEITEEMEEDLDSILFDN